jgi:hypothetical protein
LTCSFNAAGVGGSSIVSTVTPRCCNCLTSERPTPPLSIITMTRLSASSAMPVDLHSSSMGRTIGTGTRRGILSASSSV